MPYGFDGAVIGFSFVAAAILLFALYNAKRRDDAERLVDALRQECELLRGKVDQMEADIIILEKNNSILVRENQRLRERVNTKAFVPGAVEERTARSGD